MLAAMNPRLSRSYYKTFRDAPSDAETISNQLMMRAGLLRKLNPGIFSYTPLMTRALNKVVSHIREVFDDILWEECLMPMVVPAELWKETGRWNLFGDQLLRFKDRKNLEYCLGPTHEEVVTDLARYLLSSYRQLPFTLYQVQTKFRDEIRPRFGVMRAREFVMMDGYSFHTDTADLDQHYEVVKAAYCRLFDRLQLKYRVVEADTGAIGGSASHEFHVLADSGEDLILWCDQCDYASNVERTERLGEVGKNIPESLPAPQEVPTPGVVSIEDVCKLLKIKPRQTIKTVAFRNPFTDELIGAVVRGDADISLTKLTALTGWAGIEPADAALIEKKFQIVPGSYSPQFMKGMKFYFDKSLVNGYSYCGGSGKRDTHLLNTVPGRDFQMDSQVDIAVAKEGDTCARCKSGHYKANRGIEVGHIFKLGDKYSKSMNLNYLAADGKSAIPTMGCYGIGVTRVIAACIEQNHDKDGIKFPPSISPIDLHIALLIAETDESKTVTDLALAAAKKAKAHVVIDDRDLQPGVKFKDADLTGAPYQMVIGKKFAEGFVEFKNRLTGDRETVALKDLAAKLDTIFERHA